MVRSQGKPATITFFGHFGSLNSGNESTLTAIHARLRSLSPEFEFRCVCTNPAAVTAREGIQAAPITTRATHSRTGQPWLVRRTQTVFAELAQCVRAFRVLQGTDMLIIPGTGLVTDAFGIHDWGPFSLFKWVLAARLRRAQILFVSIGAGPFYGRLGKVLVKASLSLASYRSFRDDASRASLCAIGFPAHSDPVYPDLAFSLPQAVLPTKRTPTDAARKVVGLGLMGYQGRYSAAEPRPATYTTYLESLTVFAAWLLDRGYSIRLLFGDGDGDNEVINEFKSRLRQRIDSYDEDHIAEQMASSQDVLAELAQTDVVVATRFHNVLFSLVLTKPVIAISFHHKCSSLMRKMKLSEYCHDIHQIDAAGLIEQFELLEQNLESVKQTIAQGVEDARAALDEQYDFLFAGA